MSSPPPAFRIRPATRADLSALAALEAAAFPDPWSAAAIAGFWAEPGACGWLAEGAGGLAVGFALFRVVTAAHEAELLRIATEPAWQRCRVATAVLTVALAELDRQSLDSFLEVRADNRPAQELYRRLGFAYRNQRRGYYRDGCDAWIYGRPA
ncbi:MAG: GNAT family N-acetyltransferase [Thermoanaerobaculia bacterium]